MKNYQSKGQPVLDPSMETNGCGFRNATICASLQTLEMALGDAHREGSPDGKVDFEWIFRMPSGKPATLYNYKDKTPVNEPHTAIEWHIGGKSDADGQELKEWLAELDEI